VTNPPRDAATDRASFYGLGWNVSYDDHGRVRLNHSGGFELGAATFVALAPSAQLGIAVLTNAQPIGLPDAIGMSFLDLALDGSINRDWFGLFRHAYEVLGAPAYGLEVDYSRPPAEQRPALPVDAYVGTYGNDFYGPVEVARDGSGLVLRQGPRQTAFPLRHWDGDVFVYQPAGENAAGLSAVTFQVGPTRQATSVLIENLDIHGQGTFSRMPPAR
jgi:hypothetical protein